MYKYENKKPCNHANVSVKVENGFAITYCTKCGAILDTKPVMGNSHARKEWREGLIHDNGGQILHDDMPVNDSVNIQILHD